MRHLVSLALFAGLSLALSGCTGNRLKPANIMNAYDITMTETMSARHDRLILVTMRDEDHRRTIQGGGVGQPGGLPPRYASFIADLGKRYRLRRVADWPLLALDIRCLVFEARSAAERASIVAGLASEPLVETAQPLQTFRTLADPESPAPVSTQARYDDPYFDMQYGFRNMQIGDSHRFATGRGVRVAVIDTGVDTRHRDLADRVIGSKNFIDRNAKRFREGIHGTAIAGVIAAAANNAEGIVGVAPDAEIIALKACRQVSDTDSSAVCNSFALAKALNFAILQEANVINLSLAGPPDPLLARLVEKAVSQDILVVGAADAARPQDFPAYVDGVIAVHASRQEADPSLGWVSAPADQVISAYPADKYEFFSGSSLATAQISGIGALIRQRKPHLPASVVRKLLEDTAERATGTANGCRALARLVSGAECEDPVALAADP